jgi:hypothetical protein
MPQFPSNLTASGIWTLKKQKRAKQGSNWPPLFPIDPQFNYVTMLLHGNGTNGAQNNTFLDSSTNNFTITRNGNTTQGTFSPYGTLWSNYFDGTGDYLTYGNNTAFAFGTGAFTIEFWVNSNGLSDGFILSGRAAIGTMHITYGGFGGSTVGSLRYVGSSTITSGSVLISNGAWNHCAIVRDGSNNITLYVNGVSVGTGTDTTNYTTTTGTWFINSNDSGPTPGGAGYISNLRIVKGTAVYTGAFTPSTTPLTAITNTSLLTCQSNRFIDNSSNNFTITRNGDVSVQRFSPFAPTAPYAASTDGGSGYFDGSGDSLAVTSATAFDFSADFTVEGWFNFSQINQVSTATVLFSTDVVNRFQINTLASGNVIQFYENSGTASISVSNPIVVGTWNHIALVRTGTTIGLFVNGSRIGSYTSSFSFDVGALYIGQQTPGYSNHWFNGYASNVRVIKGSGPYDATQSTLTVPTAPLTAITNTSLLLNYTNAGILDNAEMNDLETVGNAQISTAQSKFGGASMLFDGNADWLQIPMSDPVNFGTGSFTIEMWVNPSTTNHQSACLFTQQHISAQNSPISICMFLNGGDFESVGNGISFGVYGGFTNGGNWVFVRHNLATIPINTWTHVALVRNGNVFTMYVNGTSVGSETSTTSCFIGNTPYFIGRRWDLFGSYPYYNGYMDEVRVSKFARYTGNFSVPTVPFPDM